MSESKHIKSSHTVCVKFTPVKNSIAFSSEIMASVKRTSISGGSCGAYPHVQTTRHDMDKALQIVQIYKSIIIEYGGTVIEE